MCEFKSFTKAGEALHLTKSTIQAQVVSLERDLGCKLYRIDNKKQLYLTQDGEKFYHQSMQVLEAFEGLFEDKKNLVKNRVRIAGHSVFMARYFPEWYGLIKQYDNDVFLSTEVSISRELAVARLISDDLDIAIFPMLDKDVALMLSNNLELICEDLWKYDIMLAAKKGHPILQIKKGKIDWDILKKYLPDTNGGYVSGSYYAKVHRKKYDIFVGEDRNLICRMVNNGHHIVVISQWLILKMLNKNDIKLVNIDYLLGDLKYRIISMKSKFKDLCMANIANLCMTKLNGSLE